MNVDAREVIKLYEISSSTSPTGLCVIRADSCRVLSFRLEFVYFQQATRFRHRSLLSYPNRDFTPTEKHFVVVDL